jgi:hypothetical protein
MRRIVVFMLGLAPLIASAADPALDKVLECMRANIPPSVRVQTIEITAWDRTQGERSLRGKLFGAREDQKLRVMVRIEAPSDRAGASYLVREGNPTDEMYLYLPSVRKVRRITGASMDGQLWGTDLSYNDLKQIQNAFGGANVKLDAPAQVDGRPVYVLEIAPRAEDASRYKGIKASVDQKTCVPLAVEFSDPAGVRKTMTVKAADVKQSGGMWYAGEAEIRDVRNSTRTRLRVLGLSNGDKLASRYFNPGTFYLGN